MADEVLRAYQAARVAVELLEQRTSAGVRVPGSREQRLHLLAASAMVVLWEAEHLLPVVESAEASTPISSDDSRIKSIEPPEGREAVDVAVRRVTTELGFSRARVDAVFAHLRRLGTELGVDVLGSGRWPTVGEMRDCLAGVAIGTESRDSRDVIEVLLGATHQGRGESNPDHTSRFVSAAHTDSVSR